MQTKFEILKKGDTVVNVWDNKIAVKKPNGDVEIFSFYTDENGLTRLSNDTILVTQGHKSVSKKIEVKELDNAFLEVSTF